MLTYNFRRMLSAVVSLLIGGAAVALPAAAQTPTHVVISQVYGGGGNSTATYTNDFVELFNPTGTAQTLTGYSVQYASAAGTTYQVTPLTGTITQPGS